MLTSTLTQSTGKALLAPSLTSTALSLLHLFNLSHGEPIPLPPDPPATAAYPRTSLPLSTPTRKKAAAPRGGVPLSHAHFFVHLPLTHWAIQRAYTSSSARFSWSLLAARRKRGAYRSPFLARISAFFLFQIVDLSFSAAERTQNKNQKQYLQPLSK